MKLLLKILMLLLLPPFVKAQTRQQIDSAYLILQHAANDTVRMAAYSMLGGFYDDINADSGLYYCNKGISIAEKLELQLNKAEMMAFKGWPLMKTGNYPEALRVIRQGLEIAEDPSNEKNTWIMQKGQTPQMYRHSVIGLLYAALEYLYLYVGNYEKQIEIAHVAITRLESARDTFNLAGIYPDIGDSYLKLNKFDSALFYQQKSLYYYSKLPFDARKFEGSTYTSIGTIYEKMGNMDNARENYQKAVQISELHDNPRHIGNACLQLANLYQSFKKADSSFLYAQKALKAFMRGGYKKEIAIAYRMISNYYYFQNNTDSSFAYLKFATLLNDSLDKIEKSRLQEFQVAAFNQQLQLQQQEHERVEKEGKIKTIAIIALIAIFSTIGLLLYRNNRQKQTANYVLQDKNSEIERTLNELKTTQKQLIQSEKMASLGELTAGIAHEIQNPLNFVNNFSEVNYELIKEIKNELAIGNEQLAKGEIQITINKLKNAIDVANDIESNSEKINQHGKRADGIVKGMLQHSRKSIGVKEMTDINKLAADYLRLSYSGYQAKNKGFECELKIELDKTLPWINIIPSDIGRVFLNLFNNAFWACAERSLGTANEKSKISMIKSENFESKSGEELELGSPLGVRGYGNDIVFPVQPPAPKGEQDLVYQSTVTLTTTNFGDHIELRIHDNGPGIPTHIIDKIFQPFFTTKPTGEGTGLGLSLSYDIIKAHGGTITVNTFNGPSGGELKVETLSAEAPARAGNQGEGSEFIIQLPIC